MIWKIFFVVFVMLMILLSLGGFADSMQLTEINLFLAYVLTAVIIFTAGYFFSLGWKKKLYSLNANNIIFSFIMIYVIFCIVASVLGGLPALVFEYKKELLGNVSENSIYLSSIFILSLVSFLLYSVIYSPVIAAYFKYKKNCEEMTEVKKPYWKLFFTFLAVNTLITVVYALFKVDYSMLNIWDYISLFMAIIQVFFLVGFAFDKKIGRQIIWKIILIPYVIFNFASLFLCSENFLEVTHMNLIFSSYVMLVLTLVASAFIYYALFKYAFSKEVYSDENSNI